MLGTREYTLCSPFRANAHNSSYILVLVKTVFRGQHSSVCANCLIVHIAARDSLMCIFALDRSWLTWFLACIMIDRSGPTMSTIKHIVSLFIHNYNKSSPRDCKFSQAAYPMYISCTFKMRFF